MARTILIYDDEEILKLVVEDARRRGYHEPAAELYVNGDSLEQINRLALSAGGKKRTEVLVHVEFSGWGCNAVETAEAPEPGQ